MNTEEQTCFIPLKKSLVENLQKNYPDFVAERAEVLLATRIAAHCIENAHGKYLTQFGLTLAKFNILMALYVRQPDLLPASQLSQYWLGSKANFSQLLTALEKGKLIHQKTSPQDARARLLKLAPMGIRMIEKVLPTHIQNVNRASSTLTDHERQELTRLLLKLTSSCQSIR